MSEGEFEEAKSDITQSDVTLSGDEDDPLPRSSSFYSLQDLSSENELGH